MDKVGSKSEPRRLVTIPQASEITTWSRSTLYALMESGRLEYVRVGRTRRIPADALASLIEANTIPAR